MLDEPLAALDHSLRLELQLELRSLIHHTGIPAIYVTHDQEEAIVVSDRLALLNEGRIVLCDQTERVFRYPINRWAAKFLGMTNFLEGSVLSVDPFIVQTKCGRFAPFISENPGVYHAGDQVTLLVKPTGIQLGTGTNSLNQFDGIVEEVYFRGDHYLVKVQVCPGSSMEFLAAMHLDPGEVIRIHLEPEDVVLLTD
jgi:ABC-type Fe3+/spermidine/putrescine transport system ATPase subunit